MGHKRVVVLKGTAVKEKMGRRVFQLIQRDFQDNESIGNKQGTAWGSRIYLHTRRTILCVHPKPPSLLHIEAKGLNTLVWLVRSLASSLFSLSQRAPKAAHPGLPSVQTLSAP